MNFLLSLRIDRVIASKEKILHVIVSLFFSLQKISQISQDISPDKLSNFLNNPFCCKSFLK